MSVTINGTTGISGVAGTASAPALIGTDADSGYYINSANEPSASVNGTAVWNAASTFGFKNRIINGAMMIDQRNAGASITPTAGQYSVDRWACTLSQASKYSAQQNAGSVTPPTGFKNYLGVTSLSAYSLLAGDYFNVSQAIEGSNLSDIGWGAVGAATVTLSFWVRSSLTGTFGGALQNSALDRSYPFTFTINSSNTWEQKSITIAGDTSGTWLTTNGVGMYVRFGLGVGSTYSGTAGTWAATNYASATGATSVVGTNGATFYITGVQLEKGSTATSFDYRPYGTELALCQRYCEVLRRTATASDSDVIATGEWGIGDGSAVYKFYAQKRSLPTITFSGTSGFEGLRSAVAWEPVTSWLTPEPSVSTVRIRFNVATSDSRGLAVLLRNQSTNIITISSEL